MKCKKCRTTMIKVKTDEHKYTYVCPKCGYKPEMPKKEKEE